MRLRRGRARRVDAIRVAGVVVENLPILIVDMPKLRSCSACTCALARGGRADHRVVGRAASLRLCPPTACTRAVPSFVGYQGRLWIRSALGPVGGSPLLHFDTGIPADYLLMEDTIPVVPATWTEVRRDARGPTTTWSAPALPSPLGEDPSTRLVMARRARAARSTTGSREATATRATSPSRRGRRASRSTRQPPASPVTATEAHGLIEQRPPRVAPRLRRRPPIGDVARYTRPR